MTAQQEKLEKTMKEMGQKRVEYTTAYILNQRKTGEK